MLMGALITFLVVILILYLINLLPLDGRAKQIAPDRGDHFGRDLTAEIYRGVLTPSFRDACEARRPGIQPRAPLWIPGSREDARPGMTKKKSPGGCRGFRLITNPSF